MSAVSSPKKKKMKLHRTSNHLKRQCVDEKSPKRAKTENQDVVDDLQAQRRKNFVTACEQVTYNAYFDHKTRLQLIYLPPCADNNLCNHNKNGVNIRQMPSYAEETMKIEFKKNMWNEALEVCLLCITPNQYLSANTLKDIVEIMMNAQEDYDSGCEAPDIIDKCQQILSLNFSTHPPCLTKTLRKTYVDFLVSPMDLREETVSNRSQFEHKDGIVKYVFNRLEHEISLDSKDEPIVNKYEHIPEDMKESVKGLYWEKKTFEIYELLERSERIERLMSVLESIIQLLQFDLVIWQQRYKKNLGTHVMRSHKPLMASILWGNTVLYTGAVTVNCRQILRLFVRMVHLQYPEDHLRIITNWLNILVQTFYICERNSNSDYPNNGIYCKSFAKEFYKLISEMPYETILRILERIQPTFMQHLVGILHIKTLLPTQDDDIIKIFTNFLKKKQWKNIPEGEESEIQIKKIHRIRPRKVNVWKYVTKICDNAIKEADSNNVEDSFYQKFDPQAFSLDSDYDQNYVMHVLYVTIDAYLDAYSVQSFQETLERLNEQLENEQMVTVEPLELGAYTVSENFIKKYRSLCQDLQQLTILLNELKSKDELPENIKIFSKLGFLD